MAVLVLSFVVPALPHIWEWLQLRLPLWTSPLVIEAVERANDRPRATALVGYPLKAGWLVRGYIRKNETGWSEGRLWIPVQGPKGEGTLYARAGRGTGPWVFTTLELRPRDGAVVNLLESTGPANLIGLEPRGRVYLVHLGIPDLVRLERFSDYYRATLGLTVDVLAPLPLDPGARDRRRGQFAAERLILAMRRGLPRLAADPTAVVIGVVEEDMYIAAYTWRFAFGYRSESGFAVVSSARLTPFLHRLWRRDALLYARVRKVISKDIGVLAYGLPQSSDPTSLLYRNIMSVDDLDLIQERFEGLGRQAVVEPTVVTHHEAAVEPEVRHQGGPTPAPDGRYPCFVAHPVVTWDGRAPIAAEVTECLPGMRTEREFDEVEVDLRSGLLVTRRTDLYVVDTPSLALTRCYRLWDQWPRSFGIGGNHPYDILPTGSRNPYTYVDLFLADGAAIHFDRISEGTGYADALYEHRSTTTPFLHSRFRWNGNGWDLRFPDGSLIVFPENYASTRPNQGAPTEMRDGQGHVIRFQRDQDRNLVRLTSPAGHYIAFDHDAAYRVTRTADDRGRAVRYEYDVGGRLAAVTDPGGRVVRYRYEGADLVRIETEDRPLLGINYASGRTAQLEIADGRTYRFRFTFDTPSADTARRVDVEGPAGITTSVDIATRSVQTATTTR